MPPKKQNDTRSGPNVTRPSNLPVAERIPVAVLFNGIYETAARGEAKSVAPEELAKLKEHLDGAVNMLQAITNKIKASKPQ
ncbi:MAG: hypothetical protein M1503_06885 [Thaumarchaeota archaeon]|nr:hypothetical protein [Nitrososphaerota archaeon]MCL5317968.1 hypothetical protein [Nitrososphaerota archaeon]